MSYRVIPCEQGSADWHQARAGAITASMFSVARSRTGGLDEKQQKYVDALLAGKDELLAREIAGYKNAPTSDTVKKALAGERVGQPSEKALNYAFRCAFERISGEPMDEGFETWQMARGHELEPAARQEHQIQTGLIVERAGFVVTEDYLFGASADGLIGDDGGSEYKCLVSAERLRAVLLADDYSEFVDQVQGCMWITGRKWWHLGFYCPQLSKIDYPLHIVPMKRDDDYIEQMERDLLQFNVLVNSYEARLRKLRTAANTSPYALAA